MAALSRSSTPPVTTGSPGAEVNLTLFQWAAGFARHAPPATAAAFEQLLADHDKALASVGAVPEPCAVEVLDADAEMAAGPDVNFVNPFLAARGLGPAAEAQPPPLPTPALPVLPVQGVLSAEHLLARSGFGRCTRHHRSALAFLCFSRSQPRQCHIRHDRAAGIVGAREAPALFVAARQSRRRARAFTFPS